MQESNSKKWFNTKCSSIRQSVPIPESHLKKTDLTFSIFCCFCCVGVTVKCCVFVGIEAADLTSLLEQFEETQGI